MNIKAMIASAVIMTSLLSPGAITVQATDAAVNHGYGVSGRHGLRHRNCSGIMDPVKALESKKSEVLKLMEEGKISREKADSIIKRIDAKIMEINEFNKLTLEQKKDKLIEDCKNRLDQMVKEGKMDRQKADDIFSNYTEKIKQWDGTGYPRLFRKSKEK